MDYPDLRSFAAVAVTPTRLFSSTSLRAAGKPVEEQSAQHPGKSDIDHLENPSLSEEVVHADRDAADPLKGKKASKAASSAGSAAQSAADQAKGVAGKVADAVKGAAGTVADAVGAGQKRGYHASAVQRAPAKPAEEQSAQHPGKSGHDHLDNPSLSEEGVHADRSPKDPLPEQHKASTKRDKGEPVAKNHVSTGKDDLSDGDATLRSMELESCPFARPCSSLGCARTT